jgi:hypothetical protein
MFFDFAVLAGGKMLSTPFTVLDSKGKAEQPPMPAGDPMLTAFEGEIKEVAQCVKSGRPFTLLAGDLARDAIVLCHRQQQSVKSGKTVKV